MAIEEQNIIRIEQYLDGKMTEGEARDFEQELQGNQVLQEALAEEQLVRDAMQRAREQDLRAKLKRWRQEAPESPPDPEPPSGRRNNWWIWLALLLLSLLSFWTYNHFLGKQPPESSPPPPPPVAIKIEQETNRQIIPEEKFEEAGESLPQKKADKKNRQYALLSDTDRRRQLLNSDLGVTKPMEIRKRNIDSTNTTAADLAQYRAFEALGAGKFAEALKYVESADNNSPQVLQIKARALFGVKEYGKAAEVFRELMKNPLFKIDAHWNLLMCYFAQYPNAQAEYKHEIAQMLQDDAPSTLHKKALAWKAKLQEAKLSDQ